MSNNFLERIDSIADEVSPVHRLNFEEHTEYKSQLGGLCTILIYLVFFFVAAVTFYHSHFCSSVVQILAI